MNGFFEINNLTCGYEHGFHISQIRISVTKGNLVGIIGPNGSGKTTLFRGITGELKSRTDAIILDGKKLNQLSYKEKAKIIAVVSQDADVPDMMVEDYILMGRIPYHKNYQFFDSKEDLVIAEKYMELTEVAHLKNKYINQLSGGERQLISITRALVQEPDILLLDEPTSHLDICHQVQVLNLVQRMNEHFGLTVLMVIHDLNLAGEYCTQLIMMSRGKIYITGTPEEVLTYQNIENVYNTIVVTNLNPVSEKPAVFLVSEKVLQQMKKPSSF
jgi:iron complex transport system ATP-binding protein